jgi:hypothetical protein
MAYTLSLTTAGQAKIAAAILAVPFAAVLKADFGDDDDDKLVKSVADLVNVNNLYDAYQWFDTVVLNAGALYVFDGVQDA